MERLLGVKDVAEILCVSEGWVRDHATRKRPRLPVVKIGKYLRFRGTDIERWIQEMTVVIGGTTW
jgi:predicted DNA-binding transcriptional regulator AlpA